MKPKVLFAGSSKTRLIPALAVALATITTGHAQNLLVNGGTTEPAAGTYTYSATAGNSGIRNGGTFKVNSGVDVTVTDGGGSWFGIGDVSPSSSLLWLDGGSMILNSYYGTILGREADGTITIDSGSLTVNKCNYFDHAIQMGGSTGKGTLNLNGGTLTTYAIAVGTNVNNVINFNGGTLKPTANKTDWIANSTNILTQVRNGGAKIDTAGFNVTIAEQLVHSTIGGDTAIDGGLSKSGDGTLTLWAANTFTGAVVVNGGTLYAGTGNSAASGAFSEASGITVTGATLKSATNSLFGYNGTKVKNITVNTGGVLTMDSGANVNVGNITLAGGTLAAVDSNHGDFGSWVFRHNSVLSVTENSTVSATNVLMNNSSSINVAAGKTLDFTGTLTNTRDNGNSTLIKTGDGTMTLSGSNTYTGTTTISAGTLSASNIVVSGGNSNLGNATSAVTLGAVSTQGTLSYTGNNASYTRGFTIGGAGGGRLDVTTSGQTLQVNTGNITGTGLFTVGGAGNTTINANLTHTGGLTKENAGTLTLSGINTFTGAVVVNNGTLSATTGNSSASGAFSTVSDITVNNGGTLTSTENALFGHNGATEKAITVNTGGEIIAAGDNINVGTVTLNGGTMSNIGANLSIYAWGSWTFRHAGDKLLVTENSTVSAQNVFMKNGAYIDVSAGKTLNFTGTLTNANSDGTGALIKQGAGTLTLTNTNTYTDATTVNGGILNVTGSTASGSAVTVGGASATGTPKLTGSGTINGAVTVKSAGVGAAGTLSAGDSTSLSKVGTLTMGSTLAFESGSIFEWDINANKSGATGTAGTDFDKVSVTGNITVDNAAIFKVVFGTGVSMADAFWSTPYVTQTWDIATIFGKGFTSGAFAPTVQTSTDVSSYGSFTINGTSLTWTAVPEPTTALAGLLLTAGLLRRRR